MHSVIPRRELYSKHCIAKKKLFLTWGGGGVGPFLMQAPIWRNHIWTAPNYSSLHKLTYNIARIAKSCTENKFSLLKYIAITTVTTDTVTTVNMTTVTIWVFFLVLSQFGFFVLSHFEILSFVTFLLIRFCHNLKFFLFSHNLSFWDLSYFEFFCFVTIWVFEFCKKKIVLFLSQFEFLGLITNWVLSQFGFLSFPTVWIF